MEVRRVRQRQWGTFGIFGESSLGFTGQAQKSWDREAILTAKWVPQAVARDLRCDVMGPSCLLPCLCGWTSTIGVIPLSKTWSSPGSFFKWYAVSASPSFSHFPRRKWLNLKCSHMNSLSWAFPQFRKNPGSGAALEVQWGMWLGQQMGSPHFFFF